MKTASKVHDDWRHVATVEIVDNSDALQHVIDDHASCYRVQPACGCPGGCSWFNILVDFGMADRQAAHAAYAVLSAAQKAACRGILLGYRIIGAQYWDELARILGHDGDAAAPAQPSADASTQPSRDRTRARAASTPRASRPTKVASRSRAKK
jgi:hypothetical protein